MGIFDITCASSYFFARRLFLVLLLRLSLLLLVLVILLTQINKLNTLLQNYIDSGDIGNASFTKSVNICHPLCFIFFLCFFVFFLFFVVFFVFLFFFFFFFLDKLKILLQDSCYLYWYDTGDDGNESFTNSVNIWHPLCFFFFFLFSFFFFFFLQNCCDPETTLFV